MIKYKLIAVLGMIFSIAVSASEITFKKVSGLESLVPESVWTFTKDDSGYLWFGNNSGLYRSDGYKVRNIHLIDPTSNITQVRKVFKDSRGKLWVGTKGNGLFNVINNQVERFSEGQLRELDYVSENLST